MNRSRSVIAVAAALIAGMATSSASGAEPLKVVTSFSILGDMVAEVGGDRVAVRTLVGPNGDAHVFAPTPADARETAAADLVVVNGLGFEGWLDRLVVASGYSGKIAVASDGVTPLTLGDEAAVGMPVEEQEAGHVDAAEEAADHHDIDPHAWQSIANAEIYVRNIAAALCEADPSGCEDYKANAAAYEAELAVIDGSIRAGVEKVPTERRRVITTHDAFGYFAHEYGIEFLAPQGVSTESEASAADVAALIAQIRDGGVNAIFVENISDPRLMQQIARETGVTPGGELYSDALSEAGGPAATYADMMRHNANLLLSAMLGS